MGGSKPAARLEAQPPAPTGGRTGAKVKTAGKASSILNGQSSIPDFQSHWLRSCALQRLALSFAR